MDLIKAFPTFTKVGKWSISLLEKDRVIKERESDIRKLNEELTKKDKDLEKAYIILDELGNIFADKDKIKEFDQSLIAIVNKILRFQEIEESQVIKKFKIASDYVKSKKEDWAKKGCESAKRVYKDLFKDTSKEEKFYQEIYQYLEWLQKSLYVAHLHVDINKYVAKENRTFKEVLPYRNALNYIIDMNDKGDLSTEEFEYIKKYLAHLVNKLLD